MWIKGTNNRLFNTDRLYMIGACPSAIRSDEWIVQGATAELVVARGSQEEMQAILNRIARALASGVAFLDLGEPEESSCCQPPKSYNATVTMNGRVIVATGASQEEAWDRLREKMRPLELGAYPGPANLKSTGEKS